LCEGVLRDGEMERWRDGEMERWRDGEMERWRDGETERGYALKEWLSWHKISVLLDFYTIKVRKFAFFKDYYRLYIRNR